MHVVSTFVKHVGRESDDGIRKVLTRLCQLHALYRIHVNSGSFIKVWDCYGVLNRLEIIYYPNKFI